MGISTFTPDKQVKLQYWLDVIRQCRASGLTNQTWCEQHDIHLLQEWATALPRQFRQTKEAPVNIRHPPHILSRLLQKSPENTKRAAP